MKSRAYTSSGTFLVILGFLVVSSNVVYSQVTTGRLVGMVTRSDAAGLTGAHVVVRNLDDGSRRGTATGANGQYQVTLLDPGVYSVTASYVGYSDKTVKSITLQVAQVRSLNFELEPTVSIADSVIVTSETPVIELAESTYRTIVSPREIQNVPLYSREVTELALLAPGTSRARDYDFYSPVYFGAMGNKEIAVFLDGLDMSAYHLGGRLGYSQPVGLNALDQFEVLTGGFPAKYGNGGGIVSMITKSGGSRLQGSGFLHYGSEALSSKNYFAEEDLPFTRYQFGLRLGGPLGSDRTRFFAAFERSQLDETRSVNTGGAFPEIEETFVTPERDNSWTLRLDQRLSNAHTLMASYTGHVSSGVSGAGGTFARDAGAKGGAEIHYLVAGHRWLASERLQLETRLGYLHSDGTTETLSDDVGRWYENTVFIGSSPVAVRGNSLLREQRWQIRSDATWIIPDWAGSHVVSGGIHLQSYSNTDLVEWWAKGQFLFATYNSTEPYLAIIGTPSDVTVSANRLSIWLQDDWLTSGPLTLNLGLRYDVDIGAVNENYLSPRFAPESPFTADGNRSSDWNNIAPRVGLAWAPFSNQRTVFRANYGIYYTRMVTEWAVGERVGDTAPEYYVPNPGTLDPSQIPVQFYPPGVALTLPEDLKTPFSHQVSVGLSQQIGLDLAFDIQYVGIWGFNEIYRNNDVNPLNGTTFQRPDPEYGSIKQVIGDGRSDYNAIHFVLRSRPADFAQIRTFYTLSWANNEFDDTFFTPVFAAGPAGWDNRHRFVLEGGIKLPGAFLLSAVVNIESDRPYLVVTGEDDNNNTLRDDDLPPGAGRNSGRADGVQVIDARLSRFFQSGPARLELLLECFNVLNNVNYLASSYVGTMSSPDFGNPTVALALRRFQVGLKVSF
jgi:hypothetical protein